MTIYKWSFAEPYHLRTTDISSLISHLKDLPAEEVKIGREVDVTPPFFDGKQVLRAYKSTRSNEGVVGAISIVNNDRTHPVLVVEDYKNMEKRFGPDTTRKIDRDNLLVAIMQGDGNRGMYVHTVITYSPKGEKEGFWQRKR